LEGRPKPEASVPLPVAPLPFTPAPPEPTPIAATAPTVETLPVPQVAADPSLAEALPDFLRDSSHRPNWRVPLVSSVLVSTGYLLLMHYLAAPLQ
jgi:hypothetical protein